MSEEEEPCPSKPPPGRNATYRPPGPRKARPATPAAPPSVLDLNAYLMYAAGKAARRRLTERLSAHGLRLWHLTILAMLEGSRPGVQG